MLVQKGCRASGHRHATAEEVIRLISEEITDKTVSVEVTIHEAEAEAEGNN